MISFLVSGIQKYALILAAVGFAALIGIAGVFALQASAARKQVTVLTIEKDRLQAAIGAMQIVIDGKDDAIKELETTTKALEQQTAELTETLTEIRSAPASDNGPIAPVLSRALRRIDGVREPARRAKGSLRHK